MSEKINNNQEEMTNETVCKDNDAGQSKEKKTDKKDKKKQLEEALEQATKEKEALNDTYIRMLAEYDNFRKRAQKEKEALYSEGIADSVEKLLPVLDNLDRACATSVSSDEAKSVLDGVEKVLAQAKEIFEKMGVTEIPALGEKFDPELHNAIMHEDDPDSDESIVKEVFMKGYKLHDKVIRYSVVKVVN